MAQPTVKQEEEEKKNRQDSRKPSLVTPRQTNSSQGIDEDRDMTDVERNSDEEDAEDTSIGNMNRPYGETQRRTESPAKDSNV